MCRGGGGASELPRASAAVEKPHHRPWGPEGWGEAAETLRLQKNVSNSCHFPRSSRWEAVRDADCILLLEPGLLCPPGHPHPKAKEGLAHVLQPGGPRVTRRARSSTGLCCFFFPAVLLQAWMLKSRQK